MQSRWRPERTMSRKLPTTLTALCPTQTSGKALNEAKSRTQARRRVRSSPLVPINSESLRHSAAVPSLIELTQKLIGWDIERVDLKHTFQNHHRMRAEDIQHHLGAKARGVINAYSRVLMSEQHIVQTRFVLNEVLRAGKAS